jgi:hypothetical protein
VKKKYRLKAVFQPELDILGIAGMELMYYPAFEAADGTPIKAKALAVNEPTTLTRLVYIAITGLDRPRISFITAVE